MQIYLLLLFLWLFSLQAEEKKIVIFSCSGGGGHIATANALSAIFENKYKVVVYQPQEELFPSLSKSYNFFLANGDYEKLNAMYHMRQLWLPLFYLVAEPQIYSRLYQICQEEKPQVLISVVPHGNHVVVDIANRFKIPFLIVTSDNDIRHWLYGLKYKDLKNFQITVSRDCPVTKTLLLENEIKLSQIKVTGLAVRPDFYEKKDKEKLCDEFNLELEKPKLIMIFGGPGSPKMIDYIEKIEASENGIHILACAGKNEELFEKLKEMKIENNTMTALSFTKRISDYMAVSDLCLTKAGPGSIEEAMIMQLPILIDGTQNFVAWEKLNCDLVEGYKVGKVIKNIDEATTLIHSYLKDPETLQAVGEAYQKVPKNNFPEKIEAIVNEMIKNNDKT